MNETAAFTRARIICIAFFVGVLLYAGIAWALFPSPEAGESGRVLLYGWAAIAVVCGFGWYAIWRRVRETTLSTSGRRRIQEGAVGPGDVLRLLLVAWALLEVVGILGVTVYVLTGRTMALIGGVAIHLFGTLISYPRKEMFVPFKRGAMPEGGR